MTLLCSSRILRHHLLEEVRNVILTGVSGITNVLTVVVPGFERVILHRNQVEGDVVESCLASSHSKPFVRAEAAPFAPVGQLSLTPTKRRPHALYDNAQDHRRRPAGGWIARRQADG